MSTEFHDLLDATLDHLRHLKAAGVQHVQVSPELLADLIRPRPAPKPASPPSRSPAVAPVSPPPRATPATPIRPAPASPTSAEGGGVRYSLQTGPAPKVSAEPASPRVPPASQPPPGPGLPAELAPSDRVTAMAAIRDRALLCQKCPHLVRSRTQVVFGVGSLDAELMFVGEAPGAEEDRKGEPFVGLAGQLLTKVIAGMNLSRDQVYIANILKCRPDMPPGSRGNRPPRPEEMDTCKPYLLSQIEIIQPKVIVALGATAVLGLLGSKPTMGSIRGRWQEFRGIPVMPTFHPSYLVRSEDGPDRGYAEKRKTWEDMLAVLERLGHPITDRMRGFFLKPPAA
ncbi:MAG: uracil-DNA glycosylase [Verrucomicrobiales bacterium]|nr:uracil-DNA glycosylase [Verrucomicrobiales bacterium]